jgi:hypothetical protein
MRISDDTVDWTVCQLSNGDRDRIYGSVVTRQLRAMGIRDKATAPASPWQNGFAERSSPPWN